MLRWLDNHNIFTKPADSNWVGFVAVFVALVFLAGIAFLTAAYLLVETITWLIT